MINTCKPLRNLLIFAFCIIASVGFDNSAPAASLEKTIELYKTGKYEDCIESAQEAIKNDTREIQWRLLLINSLMELGRYERAADQVDMALLRHPLSLRLLKLGHTANLYSGRPDIAELTLRKIYQFGSTLDIDFWEPPELVALGEALLILGSEPLLVLEQLYNRALRADPDCLDAYLASAELALEKQDYELAADQYRKGLERFGDDPDMHCGMARAFYYSDRLEMLKSIDAAMFINPNHVPSLLLLVEHKIDCEDYAGAEKSLDRIEGINPQNPIAWAYRCVLAHLVDENGETSKEDIIKQARKNALKPWPANPQVDYTIGRKLAQKYRFEEGAAYQRKALNYDPEYLPAKIQLAQDLLRLGYEQEGWQLADEVYKQDAYNIQAYNLMNLHDHMAKFETIRTDDFIVRMNKHEAAVFGDLVIELLTKARAELCEKYGIELERPTVIELFDEQQDFAVRTFGIPGGDGFLGVCFGNVITANSPKAERPNNWRATLWHEFCHVVTLNMTRNRMPRWLSEGISVYEELQRNPTWGQQMIPEYRRMILEGELTPIGELSGAFLSPKTPMHLQFAYYESALVVEFLVRNFGYETLRAILADLGEGEQVNDSISRRTAPIKDIERQFDEFARKRAESLAVNIDWELPETELLNSANIEALAELVKDKPNNFWLLTLYAKVLLAEGKWQQAKEPLNKLIELYPQYTGQDNAYMLLAQAHRNLDETDLEREVLKKLAAISSDAIYAYGRLIEIAYERQDWQEVVDNGQKYLAVHPQLSSLHWHLGRAYEELGQDKKAIESYRRLTLMDPTDPAGVNYRIAKLLESTDPAQAKKHVLIALSEAPRFRDAHRLLLKIVDEDMKTSNEQPANQESTP